MRVLAFDIGLRNLAAAVVAVKPGFTFAGVPEFKTYASDTETPDEFKQRALLHFLHGGWVLEQLELIDVSACLERTVKNVKQLGDVTKAVALTDTLEMLEGKWFSDTAPDVVCVETQHNANAVMRGVSMGVIVFFRRSFPETVMEGKSGGHKLKICDALGVMEGDGVPLKKKVKKAAAAVASSTAAAFAVICLDGTTRDDVKPAAPAAAAGASNVRGPQFKKRFASTGKKRDKYEDNKHRAILAVDRLLPLGHPAIRAASKKDDLCDVLLMSLWVLWVRVAPRAPTRSRKRKIDA